MNGQFTLYVDQYGGRWHASTVKELRDAIGGGRVSRMYVDGKDGKTYHTGYVVGQLWCNAYVPYRAEA